MRRPALFLIPAFVGACAPAPPVGLNEVGPTWVEVINQTDAEVSIGEWSVQLDTRTPWTIPEGVEVRAGGFRVIEGLSISEGVLILRSADGETVQEVDVPALVEGESWGRVPDGSGRWTILDSPSPGDSNH